MTVPWKLHYDRRVSPEFLSHFLQGGVARSLIEYARHAPFPLDFQLRANPKTAAQHATLYVGLTAVLNVHKKSQGLALSGHATWSAGDYGFDPEWKAPADVGTWYRRWRLVEDYLERVIPAAAQKHATREGVVQAAASVFALTERPMVDREAALHFRDAATKSAIFDMVTSSIVNAVADVAGVPGKPPSSFGGECDLLAIDERDRLLAIEVKPRNTASIRWAPAQATVYARLFERWIESRNLPTAPSVVLDGMVKQRVELGLTPSARQDIPAAPEVVPVVAVQRGAKATYLDGLQRVQRALRDSGVGNRALECYEVSLAGRLEPLPM